MTVESRDFETPLFIRVIRRLGPKSLLNWALLLWVLGTVAYGVANNVQGLDSGYALIVAAVAMTLGWFFGWLQMPAWLSGILGGILGIEYLLIRVGRLQDEIFEVVKAGARVLWGLERWRLLDKPFTEWSVLPAALRQLWGGMGLLLSRTIAWLGTLFSGTPVYEPVAIALVWGLGIWVISYWAGWVARGKYAPLLGILPGGIVLSFVIAYVGAKSSVLLPMLGATLVLMALIEYQSHEFQWLIHRVDFSQDLWSDVLLIATGLSLCLVLVAAVVPSISVKKLVEYVQELTEREEEDGETVAESLGLEQKPQPRELTTLEKKVSTGLPRSHLIGSTPDLSRRVAMVIKTGELPPMLPETEPNLETPEHYWRSIVYDIYFGRGWATSSVETIAYAPGELVSAAEVSHTKTLRQEVQFVGYTEGLVHVDGTLVAVDKKYEVSWRSLADMFATSLKENATTYRADSTVLVVSGAELKEIEPLYPSWITERYLQLPEDIPGRVIGLARDLTATKSTPYERALAIEAYLREYTYDLNVPYPPSGHDIADYFLFDLKRGYCDYYATAMVVLARAAGLPARMVVGYATGTYDMANARYIVTEADAHAWPEVYFPVYGWVPFEPTAVYMLPEHERIEEPLIWPEANVPRDWEPLVSDRPVFDVLWLPWLVGVMVGIVLLVLSITVIDGIFLLLQGTPKAMVTRLYHRLRRYGYWLQVREQVGSTPFELGQTFNETLVNIASLHEQGDLLEPLSDWIDQIVAAYVRVWYTRDSMTTDERRALVWIWWQLRWGLLLARMWRHPLRQRAVMP